MKKLLVQKSNIKGCIKIDGAKNSALPIICASLLNDGCTKLSNIPNITDVNNLIKIINDMGGNIVRKNNSLTIKPNLKNADLLNPLCKTFRASYYLMGVYLALFKHVTIYLPGGCSIGKRPIDFHLMGFEKLGATYEIKNDYIDIKILNPTSSTIVLPRKSLGASINIALVASKIQGLTTIENVSLDPEMIDFVDFMNKIGFDLKFNGNNLLINGTYEDFNSKVSYKVIPDRIEAATYLSLGLITNKVKIKYKGKLYLDNYLNPLIENGANFKVKNNCITAIKSNIKGFVIESGDYPKLSTDIFPVLLPVLVYANNESCIIETIYENRFRVCGELVKIGANIRVENNKCFINNEKKDITNYIVTAYDLRCAASLLIYAISKNEKITIENIDIIKRGYTNVYNKLKKLGVEFKLID